MMGRDFCYKSPNDKALLQLEDHPAGGKRQIHDVMSNNLMPNVGLHRLLNLDSCLLNLSPQKFPSVG